MLELFSVHTSDVANFTFNPANYIRAQKLGFMIVNRSLVKAMVRCRALSLPSFSHSSCPFRLITREGNKTHPLYIYGCDRQLDNDFHVRL